MFSRRKCMYFSVGAACLLALLLSAPLMPVSAASDNTNLVQQVLDGVRQIETQIAGLAGLGGSLSSLQNDVTSIKTKTSNLPDNTADVLNEIRDSGGAPLTKMFMKTFVVGTGDKGSMTCSSSGPYLLYVHAHGIHSDISTTVNGTEVGYGSLPVPQNFVLGGNAGDAITLMISVAAEYNPNAYGYAFVTMQTTEGSTIACNS